MRKIATITAVVLAFIVFFLILPGWVFIPVVPALILLVVGVLSENRPRRTQAESSSSVRKDDQQNNGGKAA
ncbi:MAG TPA: hypothetical protein VE422_06620 [Terriglobia bacterium]|nr:hypothetical protein [Terriglobia bacterium]